MLKMPLSLSEIDYWLIDPSHSPRSVLIWNENSRQNNLSKICSIGDQWMLSKREKNGGCSILDVNQIACYIYLKKKEIF